MASTDTYSGFLSLPTELRCQIYNYILADSQIITISAGYVTIFGHRIQDRARKTDIPGLPLELAPLARPNYDASLLHVTKPPEIAIDDGWPAGAGTVASQLAMPAPLALLLTCRLVNDELTDYKRGRKHIRTAQAPSSKRNATRTRNASEAKEDSDEEGLSLYVSYPHGVLVLRTMYPYLLKQASRVHISGYHGSPQAAEPASPTTSEEGSEGEEGERLTPTNSFEVTRSFGSSASTRSFRRCSASNTWTRTTNSRSTSTTDSSRPRLRLEPVLASVEHDSPSLHDIFPPLSPTTTTLAPLALAYLVRTILPDYTTQLTQFSARILYPGPDSYGSVWSDNSSPVSHILKNMCGGKIDLRVIRGNLGTGMVLKACPKPRERIVSTGWENWTALGRGRRERGRGRDFGELDRFLVGS